MTKRAAKQRQGAATAKSVMPWPTRNPRAREEYYFRSSLLPDFEVGWCHQYELSRLRQSEAWCRHIQDFRMISNGGKYEALQKEAERCELANPEDWPGIFYALWPEWPGQPYLSVNPREREKRIKNWVRHFEPDVLEQVHVGNLISDYVYESQWRESLKTKNPLPRLAHRELPKPGETIFDGYRDTVAFRLDPYLSLSEFTDQAAIWFRQYHQKRGTTRPERRGAGAPAKLMRTDLIAIGFWRLVRSGLSREEAANFQLNEADKPLLANDPAAWSRALKRAKKLLLFRLGKNFDS